ncbi:MAG TPA: biotin carboxylase N-terminal domain-containing protein [Thermomicrobiales bacterium]|nr:biotin carboxylase N-terminal domain-containing protein [Thermomicrobiales bacterium]
MTESSPVAGKRIAIANRGEIAVRIAATCRRLGAIPIVLLGDPDLNGYAARQIGLIERVGPAGSELDVELVIAAAKRASADYLHPGYGFLSERPALAEACDAAGIRFVGPSADTLRLCGDKLATRAAAVRAGVPVLPASPPINDSPDDWVSAAREIGYPLLVKPAEAGGGRGLRFVADESALIGAVQASRRESSSSGAGAVIYLERAMIEPRHVEVQVAADRDRTIAVGDRDCSIQRRHQKVIEEAPAPNIDDSVRANLHEYARRIAEETGLHGIATVEFLLDGSGEIAFLEVNPRIQVEHPVTELVTGVDLVEWQLLISSDRSVPLDRTPEPRGHAIEARVYAEDPFSGFIPTVGKLPVVSWPNRPDIRVDAGYGSGDVVPTSYDAMLAKICAHGSERSAALSALRLGLLDTSVAGPATNVPWLFNLLDDPSVLAGVATTATAASVLPSIPHHPLAPIAAVAFLIDRSTSESTDAWSAIGPWRLSGTTAVTVHGDDWEERVTIQHSADGWLATSGAIHAPVRWWKDPSGLVTVAHGGEVMKAAVIDSGASLEVTGHGGRWLVYPGSRPSAAPAAQRRTSDGRVRAPLPASVLGIHVTTGDRVERGHPLVTLSAMKMEIVCDSPVDGLVQSIHCAVGQLVEADQELVTLQIATAEAEPAEPQATATR